VLLLLIIYLIGIDDLPDHVHYHHHHHLIVVVAIVLLDHLRSHLLGLLITTRSPLIGNRFTPKEDWPISGTNIDAVHSPSSNFLVCSRIHMRRESSVTFGVADLSPPSAKVKRPPVVVSRKKNLPLGVYLMSWRSVHDPNISQTNNPHIGIIICYSKINRSLITQSTMLKGMSLILLL